jgi:hypothetical protein
MIKTILASLALSVALASGASAATMAPMKKMDHMKKMDKMSHKCGKGMMMDHGKCKVDHMMKKMKK